MLTNTPFQLVNVRGRRKRPGLLRQHLTCIQAAQAISNAEVDGAVLGSSEVTFAPKSVRPGQYTFSVGSAGSTSLVFQTVMLPLLFADDFSEVEFKGGTHNGMAPSFDFMELSFLPLIRKMGGVIQVELRRHGFYPAGGGHWIAKIWPSKLKRPVSLLERGELRSRAAVAISSGLTESIGAREIKEVTNHEFWREADCTQKNVSSPGPGNIVSLRMEFASLTSVFDAVGEKRVSAEAVAKDAIGKAEAFLHSGSVVEEHLADQLLLPLLLGAGGEYLIHKPSSHLQTNIDVIHQFVGERVSLETQENMLTKIRVLPLGSDLELSEITHRG